MLCKEHPAVHYLEVHKRTRSMTLIECFLGFQYKIELWEYF